MKVNAPPVDENVNPLFTWTANWMTVWDNRRAEDMLVLVNNATRFTIGIYQVKRAGLKNVEKIMTEAITNTLYAMNFNPEMVDAYMQLAGEVTFVKNSDRKATAWVSRAGRDCALYVGHTYNGIEKMYCDTVGVHANRIPVNFSGNHKEGFYPYEAMREALSELTGKIVYQYQAFEILVTLDLKMYKATRRLIIPANMAFSQLHQLLQKVFDWKNYHLYDFTISQRDEDRQIARLVPFEEDLEYDKKASLMKGQVLSEFLTKESEVVYTYDMGDYWQHHIQLIQEIDNYEEESPYLLEMNGQTPPEDVGGIQGFIEFRDIMLNADHPDYKAVKEWAGLWSVELNEWKKKPKIIDV